MTAKPSVQHTFYTIWRSSSNVISNDFIEILNNTHIWRHFSLMMSYQRENEFDTHNSRNARAHYLFARKTVTYQINFQWLIANGILFLKFKIDFVNNVLKQRPMLIIFAIEKQIFDVSNETGSFVSNILNHHLEKWELYLYDHFELDFWPDLMMLVYCY